MKTQHERGRPNRGRRSPWKLAVRAALAIGALLLVGVLVILLFPDTFINGFLRDRLMSSFTQAYPAYVIRIAGVHYNVFENRDLSLDVLLNRDKPFDTKSPNPLMPNESLSLLKGTCAGEPRPH